MYVRALYPALALLLIPVLGAYAGLELSFSDTMPPSPLTDDVLPVGGTFGIDVMANAPARTVAAVDFNVTWTPESNVDYIDASPGDFLPDAIVIGADANTPGAQTVAIASSRGNNPVVFGVLVTLFFTKKTGEGSVRFDFADISAMDLSFRPVTPVTGIPSSDITLPVAFSLLPPEVSEAGVTLRWRTTRESDIAGFNVFRSTSREGNYTKLNRRLVKGQGTSAVFYDYDYTDTEVTERSTYYYKVEALDLLGDKVSSKVVKLEVSEDSLGLPKDDELRQNYPNPSNPETWIPYILSSDGETRIEIYDMAAQLVRTLELGYKSTGRYISKDKAAYWDGRNSSGEEVPSGVYFYTMKKSGNFVATRKLVMLR